MCRQFSNARPFLIGFRNLEGDGDVVREPVINVDLDHPRISQTEGEAVFLRHGGNSPFLERANRMLQIIYKGTAAAGPVYAAFEEAELIEVVQIQIDSTTGRSTHCQDFSDLAGAAGCARRRTTRTTCTVRVLATRRCS